MVLIPEILGDGRDMEQMRKVGGGSRKTGSKGGY